MELAYKNLPSWDERKALDLAKRNQKATDKLLKLLKQHHGEPEPVINEPPPPTADEIKQEHIKQLNGAIREIFDSGAPVVRPAVRKTDRECELEPGSVGIKDIQRAVCLYFNISLIDMLSPRRDKKIQVPRMIAMWLARSLTTYGYPTLGRKFCRDHTSVLHSCNKMDGYVAKGAPQASHALHLKNIIMDAMVEGADAA